MRKIVCSLLVALAGSLLLLSACSKGGSPSPIFAKAALVKQSPGNDTSYLLLPGGNRLLCKGLPVTFHNGQLVFAYYTVESVSTDSTSAYKSTVNIVEVDSIRLDIIHTAGWDTLGKGTFSEVSVAMLENYLLVGFKAYTAKSDHFYLAADSARMEGTRWTNGDTLFMELRHKSSASTGALGKSAAIYTQLTAEHLGMKKESMVLAVKYKESESRSKTKYTVVYRKYLR